MKTCSKCEIEKPFTEFYKRGDGFKSHCKMCSSTYGKSYYLNNKTDHNQKMIEHYEQNKEQYKITHKLYRGKNKEKINCIAKSYNKVRRENDILFKLKHNLRVRIKEYMKSKNIKTNNKTFDFVGCTPEVLREHLESSFDDKMTWKNYGEWEIDHKIPLSQGTTVDELYKLNYYRNLQPMWKYENIKKGARLNY
jgi:hypothetical protein